MTHTPLAEGEPLYNLKALVVTVEDWAKRHRISRLATNDVGIALERVCDAYEADRQQLQARIAELERNEANYQAVFLLYIEQVDIGAARIAELERISASATFAALSAGVTGVPMSQEVADTIKAALDNCPGLLSHRHAALYWLSQQQGGEANAT